MKQRLPDACARSPQDLTATVSVTVADTTSDATAAPVLIDQLALSQVRARVLSVTAAHLSVAVTRLL